ncbi:MAG: four helix bundle protein [Thermomicrobiales bacterium]
MEGVKRFEDLVAWQKARVYTRAIYAVSQQGTFARDFGLAGQIQRAAGSTMSNIAEGFERNGTGEFHQFLVIAKASCAETRSQLYVALDNGYLDQTAFNRLYAQADEVSRVIHGLKEKQAQRRNQSRSTPPRS